MFLTQKTEVKFSLTELSEWRARAEQQTPAQADAHAQK